MPFLSIAFIVAASVWAALSIYLSMRQVAHVLARRNAVPADFAGAISLDEHQKAADYTVARERFGRSKTLIELALSAAWVFGGINLLYGALATVLPPSLGLGVAFFAGAMAVGALVSLPFDLYKTFVLEEKFGFNRTSLQTFAADRLKGALIFLAVAIPLLFAALFVMRAFAGLWWLWVWFGLLALMIAAPTVYVRLIAPRFNQFAPLADEALRLRIEQLLIRCGFRSSGLFTMDASKRSAHGNAFFIGFGAAKRIVLFDTLLSHSTPEEVEAVVAHELGHFRHGHVLYAILRSAIVTFAALAAFGWLAKQPWLLPSFGIVYRDDALSLFVCMLLASVIGPLAAPVGNWISRRNEFQADDYARQNVGTGPMVGALTKLARDNASTLTPDPVYALVNYSHPPVPIRIRHLRGGDTPGSGKLSASATA